MPSNNNDMYLPLSTNSNDEQQHGVVDTTILEEEEETDSKDTSKGSEISSSDEPEIVVPPDGGWGWVVVAASFGCNMVVDGIIFSFGIFLPHIVDTFGVSKAHVALVGSLMSGFYLMAGPFVSALANRYGFRTVAVAGSVLGCSAMMLSYFATSVEFLCISYGVIGGKKKTFTNHYAAAINSSLDQQNCCNPITS